MCSSRFDDKRVHSISPHTPLGFRHLTRTHTGVQSNGPDLAAAHHDLPPSPRTPDPGVLSTPIWCVHAIALLLFAPTLTTPSAFQARHLYPLQLTCKFAPLQIVVLEACQDARPWASPLTMQEPGSRSNPASVPPTCRQGLLDVGNA
jgi:hypothetical protein